MGLLRNIRIFIEIVESKVPTAHQESKFLDQYFNSFGGHKHFLEISNIFLSLFCFILILTLIYHFHNIFMLLLKEYNQIAKSTKKEKTLMTIVLPILLQNKAENLADGQMLIIRFGTDI